jgi:hypothetical protein
MTFDIIILFIALSLALSSVAAAFAKANFGLRDSSSPQAPDVYEMTKR